MFFAGRLLAKFGSRVMLIVGGAIMTGGLALFATSTGNLTFYIAGALVGLGYGLSIALIPPALINAWFVARAASCSARCSPVPASRPDLGQRRSQFGAVLGRLARRHLDYGSRYGGLHVPAGAVSYQEQAG